MGSGSSVEAAGVNVLRDASAGDVQGFLAEVPTSTLEKLSFALHQLEEDSSNVLGDARGVVDVEERQVLEQLDKNAEARWRSLQFGGDVREGSILATTESDDFREMGVDVAFPTAMLLVAAGPRFEFDPENSPGHNMIRLKPKGMVADIPCQHFETEDSLVGLEESEDPYRALNTIWEALDDGASTRLLRGCWLREKMRRKQILPRRQELPAHAFWPTSTLKKKAGQLRVQLVAASYCWYSAAHPDPCGEQLQTIGRIIDQMLSNDVFLVDDLAVFFDWCSLHQNPRTEQESIQFKSGLKAVNLWYAHVFVMMWMLTWTKLDIPKYTDRGWPCFERAMSALLTETARVLDVGKLSHSTNNHVEIDSSVSGDWLSLTVACTARREPPLSPEAFASLLATKKFTNGADVEFVLNKYEQTFVQLMAYPKLLYYDNLGWGALELKEVGACWKYCTSLDVIDLSGNTIDKEAIAAFASEAANCHCETIFLNDCGIDCEIANDLSQILPSFPRLHLLSLYDNPIGAGVKAVASTWAKCQKLGTLFISGSPLDDSCLEALAVAFPLVPEKGYCRLELHVEGVSSAALEELQQAWEKAGNSSESLTVYENGQGDGDSMAE